MDRAERAEGGLGGEDGEPVDALGFPFLFSLIPLADLFPLYTPEGSLERRRRRGNEWVHNQQERR